MPDVPLPTPGEHHSLVMPFIVCVSQGGPYDDQSFTAGYHLGQIDMALAVKQATESKKNEWWSGPVRTASLPQLDLIAMRYNCRVERHEPHPAWQLAADEWASVSIRPVWDV